MDRPLWQILFNIALIGFVARRAAVSVALAERTSPLLWGVYVGLLGICGCAAVAILFGRRWVIGGMVTLLVGYVLSTFVELAVRAVAPPAWLIGQLALALAFGAVILWWALRDHGTHGP